MELLKPTNIRLGGVVCVSATVHAVLEGQIYPVGLIFMLVAAVFWGIADTMEETQGKR